MATYNTSSKQLQDNYAVLQTLEPNDFVVGQSITVLSIGAPFNGTFQIVDIPEYLFIGINSSGFLEFNENVPLLNQVLFACTGDDVARVAISVGLITYTQVCTWITAGNIEDWLGIGTATAADTAFLTQCAAAANAFAYRRRQESGYFDSLTTSPSGDVTLGTIMYGGNLYRQRGSVTDFASFDGMSGGGTNGLSPMIKQLLGVNRAVVA